MRKYYWVIKERHNPQLGVYYVGEGRLLESTVKEWENTPHYGHNEYLRFPSKAKYIAKCAELKIVAHGS